MKKLVALLAFGFFLDTPLCAKHDGLIEADQERAVAVLGAVLGDEELVVKSSLKEVSVRSCSHKGVGVKKNAQPQSVDNAAVLCTIMH